MAPLHHHLELVGWPESTVTVRLWLVGALCTGGALIAFYTDWLTATGAP